MSGKDGRVPGRQDVASVAASMILVTASGRVMSDGWPALTCSIVALARSDMNSCRSTGTTLSSVPISDHDRIVSHAGGPDCSTAWLLKAGRCVAASRAVVLRSTPFAKHSAKPVYGPLGAIWR